MPVLKHGTIWPTDEEDTVITAAALSDTDNPPLMDEGFSRARPAREVLPPSVYAVLTDKSKPVAFTRVTNEEDRKRQTTKRTGRPPITSPKEQINIRLSQRVLAAFRSTGKGWQTRIDNLLLEAVEQGRV